MFHRDRDPYAALGVPPTADDASVKAAYRALARRYHPDVTSSDDARTRMIEINRAWEILGDPGRRALHQRSRAADRAADPSNASAERSGASSDNPTVAPIAPEWMARHAPDHQPPRGWGAGAAGPPPGRPSGSILGFGIYLDWSIGEVARVDPIYLDWLADRPEGRTYRAEIEAIRRSDRGGRSRLG